MIEINTLAVFFVEQQEGLEEASEEKEILSSLLGYQFQHLLNCGHKFFAFDHIKCYCRKDGMITTPRTRYKINP